MTCIEYTPASLIKKKKKKVMCPLVSYISKYFMDCFFYVFHINYLIMVWNEVPWWTGGRLPLAKLPKVATPFKPTRGEPNPPYGKDILSPGAYEYIGDMAKETANVFKVIYVKMERLCWIFSSRFNLTTNALKIRARYPVGVRNGRKTSQRGSAEGQITETQQLDLLLLVLKSD